MRYFKAELLGTAALAIAYSGLANAQSNQQSSGQSGQQTSAPSAQGVHPVDTGLGDIVVTANKREQSLSKVGASVVAFSGDTLKVQHVTTMADLAQALPGLTFQPTAYSTPVYTLRGVGFYDSSLASYPTVSTYIDQAPLSLPVLSRHSNFDLERVEVLKGPQGTLFGNNSTGGAINFIANKPTNTFQAGGDLTFGRFARAEVNGYISGPLTDTLTARVAVTTGNAGDWQRSVTRPGDTLGQTGYVAGRLLVDWRPTDTLKFELNVNGWRDTSDPQAPQFVGLNPQFPDFVSPKLVSAPFAERNARSADWDTAFRPRSDEKMGQVALRADWEFVPDITLTSLTSYVGYHRALALELDGTPAFAGGDFPSETGSIQSFSQELRVANAASNSFRWVVGGNYEHTNARDYGLSNFSDISLAGAEGLLSNQVFNQQYLRNYAGFANAEYDITHTLTLKGGVRYTQADRRVATCSYDSGDGSFSSVFTNLANAIQLGFFPVAGFTPTGVPVPPIGGGCAALDNVTFDGTPATYLPGELRAKLNQHNVSWRVGVDFKPVTDVLFYANVAKGYKAGSFPYLSGATFNQYAPVTQESLIDYEVGFKIRALDHKLSVNGAAFYYDYRNKQIRSKIPDPVFGVLDALVNVPKSNLKGGELEVNYQPVRGLNLSVAGSYIKSEITKYSGFSLSNVFTNFDGSQIPYTPKWQVNANADYSWDIGRVRPFVGASLTYRSSQMANIGGSRGLVPNAAYRSDYPLQDIFKINGYALLDLRAGFELPDAGFKIFVFGKNVTNKYYTTNVVSSYDGFARYAGMPMTWGVTLSKNFR